MAIKEIECPGTVKDDEGRIALADDGLRVKVSITLYNNGRFTINRCPLRVGLNCSRTVEGLDCAVYRIDKEGTVVAPDGREIRSPEEFIKLLAQP